ncbi:hypothetical protein CHS0354_018223 [Potamilus streckersoni]|uniref:AF4/FMR2 family member lilli n=1 Tax=Potamilus streckersoni TaxID=2493646 RepID=A0AAE0VZ25_9BIVA|nr:hypothetical protein CHS0354_018223 [Potamilus streckersoni]
MTTAELKELSRKLREAQVRTNSDDECGPNQARKNLFQSPIKKSVTSDKQKVIDNMIGISYERFNNVLETGGKAMRLVGISTTPKDVPDSPFPFPTSNSRDNSQRKDELHKEKPRKEVVHSNKRSFDKSDLTLQSFHDFTAKHVDKLNMEKLDVTQLSSHGNTAKSIDKSDVTQPTFHSITAKGVDKLDLTQPNSYSITAKNVDKSDATQSSSYSITSKNVDKSVVTQQNSHVIAAKSVDKLDVTQPSSLAITAKNVEELHLSQQNSHGITAKSDRRSGSHSSSRASHSGKESSSSPNSHKSQKTSPTPSPSKLLKSDAGNKVSISKSHGSGSHHSKKSPEEQLTGTQSVKESLADLKFLNSASKDINSRIIDNKTQEPLPMSKPPNGLVPHQSKPKPKLNIPEKPDVEAILMEMAYIQTPLTRINTPLKEKPLNFETKPRDNVFSTFEPLLPLPEIDEPCLSQNPSREEEEEEHMGEIESKANTERNVTAEPIAPITVKDEASTGTSSHVTAVKHPTTAPVKERRKKMPDSSESSSGESDSSSASGSDSDSPTSDDDDDDDDDDDEDDEEEKREEYKREEKIKPASPFLIATTLSPPSPTEGKPQQAKWSLSTYLPLPQSKNPLFSAPLSDTRTPLDGESNITTKLDTENNRVSERNSVSNDTLIHGISKRTYRNSCSSVELSPDAKSTTSNSSTKPGRKPSSKNTQNHSTSEKMLKERSSSVNNQYVSPKRTPLSSKNGSAPTKELNKDKQNKGSRTPRTNRMKKGNKSPKRILSKEFVDSDSSSSESTEERPAVVAKSEPQTVVVTTKCIPWAKSSSVSSDSEEMEEERKMMKEDGNDSKDDQSEEADSSVREVFSKSMKSPFISKPSPLPVYVPETRRCEPKECDINITKQKDQLDISGSLSKNESIDDIFTSTANSFNLLSPIPHDGPDGVFKRPPDKKPSIMVHLDREFIKSLLQKVNIEGIKSPTPNVPTKADLSSSSSSDSDSSSDSVCSDMEEGQLKDEEEEVENKVEDSEKSLFLEYSLKGVFNSEPISPLRDSHVNFMDTVSRFSPIKINSIPAKERLHEKRKLDINRHEDAKRRKSEPSRSPMKFSGDEIPEKEKDSHEDDRKWDRKHPDRLRERRGSGESITSRKSQKDRQIKKLKDHKNAAPNQEVESTVKQKLAENSKPPTAVAEPLQQNGMAHFPPSSTPSRLEASPQVKGQTGWPPRLAHWPEDGKLESYEIYYARAKELKSHADSTLDILQKHILLMEAALNFIQCAYVMERDHVPDPIKMYGETLRFVHHRCRFHSSLDSDANDRERKLSVLSYRIQSMLNLKLFKKNEALKLKRVLDDYHKNFQNSASKPVSGVPAPSPIQNKSSTGTPSPMSPTASPATSICSEMSQLGRRKLPQGSNYSQREGSDPTPSKIPNGSGPISTTHATVSLPQRIHSVIQQYVNMTNSVLMCHDLWDQANTMASAPDIRDFFAQLEYRCGILTRDSSMMDLVYYVKEALRTFQPT